MTGRVLFIRDLQVAEDIGSRAKLGWFDKEFNYFGTAYVQNEEEYYLISGNAERIYDFAAENLVNDIYCTPVRSFVRKRSVPSGTEDLIARDYKLLLGKELQKIYPKAFLSDFQSAFQDSANDLAESEMRKWQERIDGLFDEELLVLFEQLLQHAYASKTLKHSTYEEFKSWLNSVYADMCDDLIVKDVYKRDLYSLTYNEHGKRHTVINAQKERLYRKAGELAQKNILCTPIYGKTYWYNHDYRLTDARKDYETYLNSELMQNFFDSADRINALPAAIDKSYFNSMSKLWLDRYGKDIEDYLFYYRVKWHCL